MIFYGKSVAHDIHLLSEVNLSFLFRSGKKLSLTLKKQFYRILQKSKKSIFSLLIPLHLLLHRSVIFDGHLKIASLFLGTVVDRNFLNSKSMILCPNISVKIMILSFKNGFKQVTPPS